MSKSFEIRDIVAEAGTKATDYLTIQDDDAATVKLLVGIINGIKEGPVLCITAGMYGTQYPGIDACIRLYNEIDPKKVKGTLITVPVVETTGFQQCMDISPIDGLNPNGARQEGLFPGDPEGTISHRIAYTLFNEVIKKSEYHLDLRGGDLWENTMVFWFYFETGNRDFDAKTEALGKILGTKYYVVRETCRTGDLISEACRTGIHSIILEASPKGFASYDEEDVQTCIRGIYNLLKHLEMIEGNPDIPCEPKKLENETHYILAKYGGLLYVSCKTGETYSKAQKLGEIRNLKGEILQELIAPIDGIINYTFPKHIKHSGDLIMAIRRILG